MAHQPAGPVVEHRVPEATPHGADVSPGGCAGPHRNTSDRQGFGKDWPRVAATIAAAMPPRSVVLAAVLAVILAGCDGRERSFAIPQRTQCPAVGCGAVGPLPTAPLPRSAVGRPRLAAVRPTRPALARPSWPRAKPSTRPWSRPIPPASPTGMPVARCKVFEIAAEVDGTLMAAVRLSSPPAYDNLDLFLIDLGRGYVLAAIRKKRRVGVVAGHGRIQLRHRGDGLLRPAGRVPAERRGGARMIPCCRRCRWVPRWRSD